MDTKYLEFEACGQVLIRTDNITVVAGAANLYAARFSFTPEWADEVKTAQFKLADGTTYDAVITNDICDVPWEAIQNPGTVIVGVFAGNLITTDAAKLEVYESSFDPADAPVNEPTPGALPAAILKAHEYMTTAGGYADDAAKSAAAAKISENNAAGSEEASAENASTAAAEANKAVTSAGNAAMSEANALQSKTEAAQALSDTLAVIGSDVCPLVGGKVPDEYLHASIIHEAFEITDESELISLTAQMYDTAYIKGVVNDEETLLKQWQLLGDGDSAKRENWLVLGSSYAAQSGSAIIARTAENTEKVNGRRQVNMTEEQYYIALQSGTIDPDTDYNVYPED